MGDFERSWQKFLSDGRLERGGHTDPDFRDGHSLSASFVVSASAPEVISNLSPLRDALRPFPFVTIHPNHFLHVSVAFAGFVSEDRYEEDVISRDELREVSLAARQALLDVEPFEVTLANLNAFPSVAYVEVHDEKGGIPHVANLLSRVSGIEPKPGPPHLTVAYFHAPDGTEVPTELIRAMEPYREYHVGKFEVGSVTLSLLALEEEYPHLDTVEVFRFGGIS